MRIVKRKIFFAWDFEKEEEWLNKMSREGLELVSVGFCKYIFKKNNRPFTYKVELLDNLPSHSKSQDYLEFLEEMGIEHVGSYIRWVYLKKDASEGEIKLFSDYSSRINHYKKVLFLLLAVSPLMFFNTMNLYSTYVNSNSWIVLGLLGFFIVLFTLMGVGVLRIYKVIKELKEENSIWE